MRWISGTFVCVLAAKLISFRKGGQCLLLDGRLASKGEIALWGSFETRSVPAELEE
jgi:hypothetical protein